MKTDTSWKHAASQTRESYRVWGTGFWSQGKGTGTSHSKNIYHKARAKLLFGNILTLGLINVGLMVSVKRSNERKAYWEEVLRAKVEQFATMAHNDYQLDEGDFIRYFKYKLIGGDKPDVTPSKDTAFGRGWKSFLTAHRQELIQAGVNWWE